MIFSRIFSGSGVRTPFFFIGAVFLLVAASIFRLLPGAFGADKDSLFSLSRAGNSRPSSTDHLFSLSKGAVSELMEKALQEEQFERVKAIYETLGAKGSAGAQAISAPDLSILYSKALTRLGNYGMAERQLDQLKSRELGLEMKADVWKTFGDLMSEKGDYGKAWEAYETAEKIYLTKNFGLKSPNDLKNLYAKMEKGFARALDRDEYIGRLLLKKGMAFKGELYGNTALVELADRVLNEGFTSDRYARAREILEPVTGVPVAWKEGAGTNGNGEGDEFRRLKLRFLQIRARGIVADSYFKEGLFPEAVREGKLLPEMIDSFLREGLSRERPGGPDEEVRTMKSETAVLKSRIEKNLEWIMRRELVISASSSVVADGVLNLSVQARNIPSVKLHVMSVDFVELVEKTRTFAWSDKEESLAAMFEAARSRSGAVRSVDVPIEGYENHRLAGKIEDLTPFVDWFSQAVLVVAEAGDIRKFQVVLVSSVAVLVYQDHDRAAVFWADMGTPRVGDSTGEKVDILFAYGHSYNRNEGRYVYKCIKKIDPAPAEGTAGKDSADNLGPGGRYGHFVLEFPLEVDHNNLVVMVRTPRGIGLSAISYVPRIPRNGEIRTSVLCLREEYTSGIDFAASAVFVTRRVLSDGCKGVDDGRIEMTVRDDTGVKKIDFKGISGPGIRDYGTFSHTTLNLAEEVFPPGVYRGEVRSGFESRAEFIFGVSPRPGKNMVANIDCPPSVKPDEQFSGKVAVRDASGNRISGFEFGYRIGELISGTLTTDGAGEANIIIPAGGIRGSREFFTVRVEDLSTGALLCGARVDLARSPGTIAIDPMTRFFGPGVKGSDGHCRVRIRVAGSLGEPVPANLTVLVTPHALISPSAAPSANFIDFRAAGGTCEAVIKAREFRHGPGPYLLTVEAESGGRARITETSIVWFMDRRTMADGGAPPGIPVDLGLKGVKVIPIRSSALPGETLSAAVISAFGENPVFFLVCGRGIYDWGIVNPGPDGIGFFDFKVFEDTSGAVWVKAMAVNNRYLAVDEAPIFLESMTSVAGIRISMPELGPRDASDSSRGIADPGERPSDPTRDCLRPGDRVDFIFKVHGCDGKQIVGLRDSGGKIYPASGSTAFPKGSELFAVYRLFRTPVGLDDDARIPGRRMGVTSVRPSAGLISSFLGESRPSVGESVPDCLGRVSDPYPQSLDILSPDRTFNSGRSMISSAFSSWPLEKEVIRSLVNARNNPEKEIFRIPADFEGLLRVEAYFVSGERIGEAAIEVPVRPALAMRLECPDDIFSGDWTRVKTTILTDFQVSGKDGHSGKKPLFVRSSLTGAAVGLTASSGGETIEIDSWDSVSLGIPAKAIWTGAAGIDAFARGAGHALSVKREINVLGSGFALPWGEEIAFSPGSDGMDSGFGKGDTFVSGAEPPRVEPAPGGRVLVVGRDLWDCGASALIDADPGSDLHAMANNVMALGHVLQRVLRKPGTRGYDPARGEEFLAMSKCRLAAVSKAFAPVSGLPLPFALKVGPFTRFGVASQKGSPDLGRTRNPERNELFRAAAVRRMARAWEFMDDLPKETRETAEKETEETLGRAVKVADSVIEAGIKGIDLTNDPGFAAMLLHSMSGGNATRIEFASKLARIYGAIAETIDLEGAARLVLVCIEEGLDSEAAPVFDAMTTRLAVIGLTKPMSIRTREGLNAATFGDDPAVSIALSVRAIALAGKYQAGRILPGGFLETYQRILSGSFGSDGWCGSAGTAETLFTLAVLHDLGILRSGALEFMGGKVRPDTAAQPLLEMTFMANVARSQGQAKISNSGRQGSEGPAVASGRNYTASWPGKTGRGGWPGQAWPGGPLRVRVETDGTAERIVPRSCKWLGWTKPKLFLLYDALWPEADSRGAVGLDIRKIVRIPSEALHGNVGKTRSGSYFDGIGSGAGQDEGIFRGAIARIGLTLSLNKKGGRLMIRDRLPGGATAAFCPGQEVTVSARGEDDKEVTAFMVDWIWRKGGCLSFHVPVPLGFSGEILIEYPVRFDHAGEFLVPAAGVWSGGGVPTAVSGESRIRVVTE